MDDTSHNPLRGTGINKLGWTEGGKQHSNAKRLLGTTEGISNGKDKSKNQKVVCDKCNSFFNIRGEKLPSHKREFQKIILNDKGENEIITTTENCDGNSVKGGKVKLSGYTVTTSRGVTVIKPGDSIIAETSTISGIEILEKTIKSITEETNISNMWFYRKPYKASIKKNTIIRCTDGTELSKSIKDIVITQSK